MRRRRTGWEVWIILTMQIPTMLQNGATQKRIDGNGIWMIRPPLTWLIWRGIDEFTISQGVDMSGFPYDFLRQWVCLNDYTRSLDGKIVKLSIRLKSTYPYSYFTMLSPWSSFSRRRPTQSHLSPALEAVSPQRRLFQPEGPFSFRSQSRHQFELFHSVIMILPVPISNQEDSNVP